MRMCFFRVSLMVLGLTLLSQGKVDAQFADEQVQILDDSTATEVPMLVAKSPYAVVPAKDSEIAERLNQLSSCVELRNTNVVRSYVRHYLTRPDKTKRMLGKRAMYFHIFEQKLKEYGLPTDLKYLSVVESALNPVAVSRVGASGLWQFMPSTGTDYGLQINSAIDERNNVIKSTDAAARYLRDLYKDYGDWALALAAYNSGPGRVNAAIKRSRSRNFWVIQRYLPEETRNYVPAFVAATYICNFYGEHSIQPDYPEMDEQLTDYIAVYDGISFSAIASATGISYKTISNLNPGFRRAYVPPSKRGYYITLPRRVMPAFVNHLNSLGGNHYKLEARGAVSPTTSLGDGRYVAVLVTPTEVDYVDHFAEKYGVSGAQLRAWNNTPNRFVYPTEPVKIFYPVVVQKHSSARIEAPGSAKVRKVETANPINMQPNEVKESKTAAEKAKIANPNAPKPKEYQWHTVGRNESLSDIARRYSISSDALMMLNNIGEVKTGMRIKIKEIK